MGERIVQVMAEAIYNSVNVDHLEKDSVFYIPWADAGSHNHRNYMKMAVAAIKAFMNSDTFQDEIQKAMSHARSHTEFKSEMDDYMDKEKR